MRRLLPALALLTGCAHSHRPLPAPPAVHVKSWTDQAEYDLANAAAGETDPATRLAELDKWTAEFPKTDYINERQDMYLNSYLQSNQARPAFDKAQEILKVRPNQFQALGATLSQMTLIKPTAADLDAGEKIANLILYSPDTVLAAANKPPEMTEAQWAQARNQIMPYAEQALLAIYQLRNDDKRAVSDLTKLIQRDSTLARASYQLGRAMMKVLYVEKRPEAQPPALYQFARSVAYDGPNAVPAAQRPLILDYLTKAYAAFHGSTDGLDQLLALAKSNPFPPPYFTIQSTVDIAIQVDAERRP